MDSPTLYVPVFLIRKKWVESIKSWCFEGLEEFYCLTDFGHRWDLLENKGPWTLFAAVSFESNGIMVGLF